MAVPKNSRALALDYPRIKAHKSSHEAYGPSIEVHLLNGAPVKIYHSEKTLVDCFKFRNKIGEALKLHKARNGLNLGELLKYASVCRVEKVMRLYLEAIL